MPQMPATKGKWQSKKMVLTYVRKGYKLIILAYKGYIQIIIDGSPNGKINKRRNTNVQ